MKPELTYEEIKAEAAKIAKHAGHLLVHESGAATALMVLDMAVAMTITSFWAMDLATAGLTRQQYFERCGETLKSHLISYGEELADEAREKATEISATIFKTEGNA